MKKLSTVGRISVFVVIGFVVMLWFFPMWRIDLVAPQYPEGIFMQIWINDVKGDVDIINGLNHYIGMKTIHKEDFKEFIYLPIALMGYCGLGLLVLLWGRKKGYYIWAGIFLLIAGISMYDFWKWEYDYGHNLDPSAPIKVPGMAYQPPLIGYKKMLNFEALSQPDIGGWFFISAGMILAGISWYEWKRSGKRKSMKRRPYAPVCILLLFLMSCSRGFEPVDYGKDACVHCRMTIVDERFASELVDEKGKVFKFDDLKCMKQFIHAKEKNGQDNLLFVEDYLMQHEGAIDAVNAVYLEHDFFASPMRGNYAAFTDEQEAQRFKDSLDIPFLSWNDLK